MRLPFRRSRSWVPIPRVLIPTSTAVFVGNTPSDVQIAEGEPTVAVKKVGFKDWERKLKVTGGNSVSCLNAEFEKLSSPERCMGIDQLGCARLHSRGGYPNMNGL